MSLAKLATKPFVTIVAAILLAAGLIGIFFTHHREKLDARLASPVPLLQGLAQSGTPIYITPEFLPCATSFSDGQRALFPSLTNSIEASHEKSAFWKLNREHHYSAVLIGVNPTWRPLMDSLLSSQIWILSDVTPWGYLLRPKTPANAAWQMPSPQDLEKAWPSRNDRALFLILTASNLAAIDQTDEAEQLLTMADSTHEFPSLLLSTEASIAAARGDWEEAEDLAKSSLGKDRANRAARETLIRALVETGHTDEALDQAREFVKQNGENETALFLLARTANAANSRQEEIDALAQMITVARKNNQPLGASLTYLGQAYAKNGERGDALRAFQQAIAAPELTEEERKVIREAMDHLMQGNASSTTLPSLPSDSPPATTNQ